MFVMDTAAPTAKAPARKHRSTIPEFRTTASGVAERTRHSSRTSDGTELTACPPAVIIPCIRTVSCSRYSSRFALIACNAKLAAFSALTPRCGTLPACAARPVNRTYLTICPLLVPPSAN